MLCQPKKWASSTFSHSCGPKTTTLEGFSGWGVLFFGIQNLTFGPKSVGGYTRGIYVYGGIYAELSPP